jgi:hypothetical protein
VRVDVLTLWRPTLQERFEDWLATPDGRAVYANVRDRALRLRARGWRHFGIAALWEAARYDRALEVGPDEAGFKVNNDYRSRMARLLMDDVPGLADFFEVRELRA